MDIIFRPFGIQMRINILTVNHNIDQRMLAVRIERNIIQQILHHGVQTACADILILFICPERILCNLSQSVLCERQVYVVRTEQCRVLFCYGIVRLR